MADNRTPGPEEMAKLLEEAQKKVQAMLDKMTPEERARAEAAAKQLEEADRVSMQKLIDDAKTFAGAAPQPAATPRLCPHCGAQVDGGNFCACCGSRL